MLVVNVAVNLVVIPEYGADGAAAVAAFSAFLLFALGFLLVRSITGRVRLVRPLGAATAGGLAMAGTVLVCGLPPVAAGVAGLAAYAIVFLGFERLAFPEDLTTFRALLRRRRPPARGGGRVTPAPGAGLPRAGRAARTRWIPTACWCPREPFAVMSSGCGGAATAS